MEVLKENFIVDTESATADYSTELAVRTYAVIEAECNELDHIIELLGQFFPKTKILECNTSGHVLESVGSKSSYDPELHPPQTFKGKVKGYLQRRYLEQTNEHPSNLQSSDLSSSSSLTLQSHSFEDNCNHLPLQSKRPLLQCSTMTNTQPLSFSLDEEEEEQTTTKHSDHQETKLTHIPLPSTPFSASSDPGPFRSPWLHTPTSYFNFRFPQSQEPASNNAQGSITQLSTLTTMLCDEPSLFTPTSSRFTPHHPSSSARLFCQICREEFESHQTYLTHYRTHLESVTGHDDKSVSHNHCNRANDSRNHSCQICSKRFSRSDMLNRHLRLHSGIRPYRCTLCHTQFSRSDHLSTHFRTHTGEKPYTCPQCSYTACRRDMITRHLKIHLKQRSERKYATSTFTSSNDEA